MTNPVLFQGIVLSTVKDKRCGGLTYFVDVVHLYDVIKKTVEVIEEGDHLQRRANRAHGREAHNVREENCHHFVAFWLHQFSCHQLFRNVSTVA